MSRDIIIADYGVGNLRSIARAVEHCGSRPVLESRPNAVEAADRMILPGVGAFASCLAALKEHGLEAPIRALVESGRPVLGICVGMQMLLDESEEFGVTPGFGFIAGAVKAIPNTTSDGNPHKIPHIGWSGLQPSNNDWDGSLLADLNPGEACYFVHSFAASPKHKSERLADCVYNGRTICAAVRKGNLYGVQFHPEKSGPVGLKILARFIAGDH